MTQDCISTITVQNNTYYAMSKNSQETVDGYYQKDAPSSIPRRSQATFSMKANSGEPSLLLPILAWHRLVQASRAQMVLLSTMPHTTTTKTRRLSQWSGTVHISGWIASPSTVIIQRSQWVIPTTLTLVTLLVRKFFDAMYARLLTCSHSYVLCGRGLNFHFHWGLFRFIR